MTLSIAFHGGAGTVTGSRFLVESEGQGVLVDCGQFQGLKALRLLNWAAPPFDARKLEAVLLTHAHIDHSGYLPRLFREGFRGHIYATPATIELAGVLLLDAARLQEEDADFARRKGFSKHNPPQPLFTTEDAEAVLRRMRPIPFDEWRGIGNMRARYHVAGHILGSACIELACADGEGGETTLLFSGDLGRYAMPLHPDPAPMPACDTLILEATYGDREHESTPLEDQLVSALRRPLERRATVLIPSFAVARAQLIVLIVARLIAAGRLPRVPIHIDSPMAVDVTRIYERYADRRNLDPDIHLPRGVAVTYHRSVEESKRLNEAPGPRIIVSSSGMLTGGRVLHHVQRLAGDPGNVILLAGFQAEGTRGRALLDGKRVLRIHGGDIGVRAQVVSIDGFSAHADREGILQWIGSGESRPASAFLVHGEPEALAALAKEIEGEEIATVIPRLHERFEYVPSSRRWRSAGRG
jgi:metallo-beta-lactamase family protein